MWTQIKLVFFAPFLPKRNQSKSKMHWQETKVFTKVPWRTLQRDYTAHLTARGPLGNPPKSFLFLKVPPSESSSPNFSFLSFSQISDHSNTVLSLPSLLSAAAFPEWDWEEIPPGHSTLLLRTIPLPLSSLQRFHRSLGRGKIHEYLHGSIFALLHTVFPRK